MKKLIMLSFAALGIVVLTGCGQLTQSAKKELPNSSPTSPKISTSQVYQNKNLGFKFEYPKDFCFLEGEAGGSYIVEVYSKCPPPEDRGEVGTMYRSLDIATIIVDKTSESLKDYVDSMPGANLKNPLEINGAQGYYVHINLSADDEGTREDFWEFENNGNLFTFTDNKEIVDQILPSFEFIK